ncbi:MAG: multicopper oxidase domain-containing protein [Thermohalobaculum sp.]|nr:multicopper oxidase domain-containing protein [Thermohalobaculum sp.]
MFPDTFEPSIISRPSPPVEPFTAPLHVMKIAEPVPVESLDPAPEPERHQRYDDFVPQKFYREVISEFRWKYHWQEPYGDGVPGNVGRAGDPDKGTWSWGFNGQTPGETYHARYGEPVFVRRENDLPEIGEAKANFALPSPTIHLHNGHTASESDGIPQDFTYPGEFWDHHYANFPAGFDDRETMTTLWYHDHRLDFTATNVYAGLAGFYLLFDERDSGDENDPNPNAFRLPSGEFDLPLIFHDVQFDENGQVIWDFFNPSPEPIDPPHPVGNLDGRPNTYGPTIQSYTTNGMVGDRYTCNRVIQPYHEVTRRKYRLRLLNGGPSRLYRIKLQVIPAEGEPYFDEMVVLTTDGNMFDKPQIHTSLDLWIAQRYDVIVDFSKYQGGDKVRLVNDLEIRTDGAGPTGFTISDPDGLVEFQVQPGDVEDPSQIPATLRTQPDIDLSQVRRERLFVFDYDNGLWTVNGRLMDPNRVDAAIEQGSAEIWTFRNEGANWAHPVHTHFEEFRILEINGKPVDQNAVEIGRKDVVSLGPKDEVKFYSRWRDFFGKHVMHCHNVVHEDHAMMIRWDIVEPGQGD